MQRSFETCDVTGLEQMSVDGAHEVVRDLARSKDFFAANYLIKSVNGK